MATREQLRSFITASPFLQFVIRLTGGRTFVIQHPENAACDPKGRALVVLDHEGIHQVEMLLVEVMEPVNGGHTKEPPRGKGKKGH